MSGTQGIESLSLREVVVSINVVVSIIMVITMKMEKLFKHSTNLDLSIESFLLLLTKVVVSIDVVVSVDVVMTLKEY